MKKIGNTLKRSAANYSSSWAAKAPKKKAGIIGYMTLLELLVLLPELLISMPLLILAYCYVSDSFGTTIGDASTLPSWFSTLLVFTAIITILIIGIMQLLIFMTIRTAWKNVNANKK